MRHRNSLLKETGILLIITTLVLSSSVVIGKNENTKTIIEIGTPLTSLSNTKIINKESMSVEKTLLWDNGWPDGSNALTCFNQPSHPYDRLIIDDFLIPEKEEWIISDGHFHIITDNGSGPEAITGVKAFFFGSIGLCDPNTTAFAQLDATFNATLTGTTFFGRPEIAVDCQFDPITLSFGEWWVCFQPVSEEEACFWLTAEQKNCSIYIDYPDVPYPRWTWGFAVWEVDYDVAWSIAGEIVEPNLPPSPPIIRGPHIGKINTNYTFSLGPITDPNGDQLYGLLDWGDGNTSDWLGPFNSEATVNFSHIWRKPGTHTIKVKLKDIYGAESNWSEPFTINITSKIFLAGIIQNIVNQSEEYTIFNLSHAVILQRNPTNLKLYSSIQILILPNEFQGLMMPRIIIGRVYALVL